MTLPVTAATGALRRMSKRSVALAAAMAVAVPVLGFTTPASAAVGDQPIAWLEIEDGQLSGGPALNSGDHGNFSGTGSYTFRETGMMSTMQVNAPEAGTYPIHVRYAAGWLSAAEDVTRSMGLLTNGGSRQQMSLPITSTLADEADEGHWESWDFWSGTVDLNKGANTIAIQCDRSVDFCRLNFDAIQVGGTTPDPCVASQPEPRFRSLFDGTFASFDRWRKAGAGGFGMQAVSALGEQPCYLRGFRGRGTTWLRDQQTGPYTLKVDWNRPASDRDSNIYIGSSSRGGVDPVGGIRIPIGANAGAVIPTGGTAQPADAAAFASAVEPVGSWNTYTIKVTGSKVRVLLNGTLVNTADVNVPATGFIGVENGASGPVNYKNIRVADLVSSTTAVQVAPESVWAKGTDAEVSVQVTAAGGTPTGDVEFSVEGTPVGTATLVDGAASATVGPFPTAGARSITARYLGSDAVEASSGSVDLVVNDKASSTTKVHTSPASVAVKGGAVRVSAQVAAAGVTPTGAVEFSVDGTRVATATLVNGTATATVGPFPTVGTRSITARYLGSNGVEASSGSARVVVNKVSAKLSTTVKPRKIVAKKTRATVRIRVQAPGVTPTGRVTVKVGKKTVAGTLRGGQATVRLPKIAKPGRVKATVTYAGNAFVKPVSTTVRITVKRK